MKENEVIIENTNNNNLTANIEDMREESAIKIHLNDDKIETNFDGTIV
jgi:hypothetical protein